MQEATSSAPIRGEPCRGRPREGRHAGGAERRQRRVAPQYDGTREATPNRPLQPRGSDRRSSSRLRRLRWEALRAVEYELPSFDTELHDVDLAAVARARVEIRHVRGASDATYLINAFGEELLTPGLR